MLAVLGILLIDLSLYQFRKIPFTCSYLPGKGASRKVRLAAYALAFLFFSNAGVAIEFWAMHRLARFIVLFAILTFAALWARRRRAEFAASPHNRIQFEDLPPADVFALDLRRDGAWSSEEAYVDAIDPHFGRTLRQRLRPFALAALALVLCGFLYEKAGEWRDRTRLPRIGRSVDIGGRSLNIYCSGEGSPTVILESNWGMPGYSWVLIQREIAKFTRACWYAPAGYGWSDPGPFPNRSDAVARDLHKLLTNGRIAPPYVLAGYSLGGFHVRVYRGFYPDEVAGMVLVDPMNEDMTIHIHNHIELFRPAVVRMFQVMGTLGWFRLIAPEPGPPPRGFTADQWSTIAGLRSQAKAVAAMPKEPPLWVNGELARASGGFGNLPLIVLSAGVAGQAEDPKLEDQELKLELHAKLAQRSSRGTQIVVSSSGHAMPYEAPEAVIDAVQEVVGEARAGAKSGGIADTASRPLSGQL